MKVYFVASIKGKKKYQENYHQIVEALQELGSDVISDHILNTTPQDIEQSSKEDEKDFYNRVKKWIKKSDIIVAEVSHRSTNVGHEVSLALSKNKPVVLLHVKGKTPSLFKGIDSDKLQLISYQPETVRKDLKYALDYAQDKKDTRFNFFISPKHQNYLDWISKEKRIPRSVFLRQLIEEHMRHNDEYM
jgi:hypothetical protein